MPLSVCGSSLQARHVLLTAQPQLLLLLPPVLQKAPPQCPLTAAAECGSGSWLMQHAPRAARLQQQQLLLLVVLQEVQAQLSQTAAALMWQHC
jgi:hypothetical protein